MGQSLVLQTNCWPGVCWVTPSWLDYSCFTWWCWSLWMFLLLLLSFSHSYFPSFKVLVISASTYFTYFLQRSTFLFYFIKSQRKHEWAHNSWFQIQTLVDSVDLHSLFFLWYYSPSIPLNHWGVSRHPASRPHAELSLALLHRWHGNSWEVTHDTESPIVSSHAFPFPYSLPLVVKCNLLYCSLLGLPSVSL